MYDSSVATTTSVLIGAYTAPPAHLPRMIETCGHIPDSGSWRRPISAYQASDVTASWMRAPPESLMPTQGQPILAANSMIAATLRPNISPTEPPNTVWSCENTATGRPSTSSVAGDDAVAVQGVRIAGLLASARRPR